MDTTPNSPPARSTSPEPWVTPSLAIGAIPPLDRSVSTASSVSSVSGRSASSRLSDGGRRRGYMRPEGTEFSTSAKNRESVMNLGTIAHLQYYFARTGLLDTATGRVAKGRKPGSRTASGNEPTSPGLDSEFGPLSPGLTDGSEQHLGEGFVESPLDESASMGWEDPEPMMLPPTVSTYKNNPIYVPPPPDMTVLRRELRESLAESTKHLNELEKGFSDVQPDGKTAKNGGADASGWHEVQGLNLLDVTTLAIRAAKNYYTAHEEPQRLYAIKSERTIRKELYDTLEVLKRLAIRNFGNGVQPYEVTQLKQWVNDIGALLDTEEDKERIEQEERENWSWREGDWSGKEREREVLFLRSFDSDPEPLPEWTTPVADDDLPTPFLASLQTGLRLVHLHNTLVRRSKRHFEEIKTFHTDTAKPYRCADNLRYWVKAAELRWDIKLDVDVMGIVQGKDAEVWRKFDAALLQWCQGVREEITLEWLKQKNQARTPTLQIDPNYEAL
ncbi:Transcription factor SUM-1 [Pyrenophora seminiperda CCB06]|uniref:Transcription factor SUM-1 n=1 Tax=Pyrenophora seminiperda CCB06 TaxID=1302712 RepID=A0A3M7MCF5_9PLEO|nr:Transcription factor SUM-1 [Pyrenophora seminiperda CCB06]